MVIMIIQTHCQLSMISNSFSVIQDYKALREVMIISRLKSDGVVRYYNSWSEDDSLFIQMEYCCDNLKNILETKPSVFGGKPNEESMQSLEYYISCQLFIEILRCVQCIHELNPPVIHRDLKPANILFTMVDRFE